MSRQLLTCQFHTDHMKNYNHIISKVSSLLLTTMISEVQFTILYSYLLNKIAIYIHISSIPIGKMSSCNNCNFIPSKYALVMTNASKFYIFSIFFKTINFRHEHSMESEYKCECYKHFEPIFRSLGQVLFEIRYIWRISYVGLSSKPSNAPSIWVFGTK